MPTFMIPQLQMLKDVPLGALVGFKVRVSPQDDPADHLGIRVERADDGSPAVVLLHSSEIGMEAIAMPRNGMEKAMLNPDTFVLNHSTDWTLVTHPNRWDATYTFQTFARANSGFLLLRSGALGMTVLGKIECTYFNMKTWQIEDVNSANYVSTRHWGISLPGVNGKADWVFKIPDSS